MAHRSVGPGDHRWRPVRARFRRHEGRSGCDGLRRRRAGDDRVFRRARARAHRRRGSGFDPRLEMAGGARSGARRRSDHRRAWWCAGRVGVDPSRVARRRAVPGQSAWNADALLDLGPASQHQRHRPDGQVDHCDGPRPTRSPSVRASPAVSHRADRQYRGARQRRGVLRSVSWRCGVRLRHPDTARNDRGDPP